MTVVIAATQLRGGNPRRQAEAESELDEAIDAGSLAEAMA